MDTVLDNWNKNRWQYHLLFWFVNIVVYLLFQMINGNSIIEAFCEKLSYLPSHILGSYVLAYKVIPLFIEGKIVKSIMTFLILTYVICVMARLLIVHAFEPIFSPHMEVDPVMDILTNVHAILGQYFLLTYITPIFFILAKSTKDAFANSRRITNIELQKKQIEVNFLRAQVHPHFLFNTLNNIYSMALKKDPATSETTGTLADILFYMQDSSQKESVTISEEIQLLNNYIALEKIRYGERLKIDNTIELNDNDVEIAPLLLLTFVENAFKHGVSGNLENPWIKMSVQTKGNRLHFEIENNKPNQLSRDLSDYRNGIGLTNVKRQLELIYGADHSLHIEDTPAHFIVRLVLPSKMPK